MLGVSILIIVMSVMNGFKTELTKKILGLNPHIIVESNGYKINDKFINELKTIIKNVEISKTFSGEGVVIGNGNAKGVILKGLDINNNKGFEFLKNNNKNKITKIGKDKRLD